jgi:hypothetical protein
MKSKNDEKQNNVLTNKFAHYIRFDDTIHITKNNEDNQHS